MNREACGAATYSEAAEAICSIGARSCYDDSDQRDAPNALGCGI